MGGANTPWQGAPWAMISGVGAAEATARATTREEGGKHMGEREAALRAPWSCRYPCLCGRALAARQPRAARCERGCGTMSTRAVAVVSPACKARVAQQCKVRALLATMM